MDNSPSNYDKFASVRPLMREWLNRNETDALIASLKSELARGPLKLVDLGKTKFAVEYRSYMFSEKGRRPLPGEIKAVLKEISGVCVYGPSSGEVCSLVSKSYNCGQDKFEVIKPQMLAWIATSDGASYVQGLKEQLRDAPLTLVDLGLTDFAMAYKNHVQAVHSRRTIPGEIKAVLKLIPELSIRGVSPKEVCGLTERTDESYWGVETHVDRGGEVIGNSIERGGLRKEGWIDDLDLLKGKLKRLSGLPFVDMARVNAYVDRQKVNDSYFRTFDNKPASFKTADMKVFDTGLTFAESGKRIMARFLRTTFKGWQGVDLKDPDQIVLNRAELINAESLFCQVYMPDGWLADLKGIVQDENWTINSRYPDSVLMQYLKLTYFKLRQQGKLYEIPGVCQIFNTGLVDGSYNHVLAYLVPNESGPQPWKYKCFGIPMVGTNGRLISDHLGRDLQKARWFESVDELYFDTSIDVVSNHWHCMVENAARLPRSLIRRVISDESECEMTIRFLDEIEGAIRDGRTTDDILSAYNMDVGELESDGVDMSDLQKIVGAYFKRLPDCANIERKLRDELDAAVRLAKKIVDNDYTAAVPMYYPVKRKLGLLLPLAFDDPTTIDCALVVEKNRGGRYEGSTILTCEMAYADARLLRKPDAQWILKRLPVNEESGQV